MTPGSKGFLPLSSMLAMLKSLLTTISYYDIVMVAVHNFGAVIKFNNNAIKEIIKTYERV